jgi:hypothetical protein
MAGCQENKSSNPDEDMILVTTPESDSTYEGISANFVSFEHVVEDGRILLSIEWKNDTKYEVLYGESYVMERLEDGEWVRCKLVYDNLAFISIGYILKPGEAHNKVYTLSNAYDVSTPGKYRFLASCYVSDSVDKNTECNVTVTFELDECDLYVNEKLDGDLLSPGNDSNDRDPDEFLARKPVIYLYPETETDVSVQLDLDGELTCTYPAYKEGWKVLAKPDGTLTDVNGQSYNYLYWEAIMPDTYDMSQGFCVRGEDTANFLELALEQLHLNRKEANEFIIYWLPLMEQNPYNLISFQTEAYTNHAELVIDPAPETLIRVFMAWQASEVWVDMLPQELTAPNRTGFTVVEWGGAEVR